MKFVPHLISATESAAVVELHCVNGDLPEGLRGRLIGPTCLYARTLPNEYEVQADGTVARILMIEPCYWSTSLPFLYTLHLECPDTAPETGVQKQVVGFRRLVAHRQSLFWDSRRVVLRGVAVSRFPRLEIADVRAAGAALIVSNPSPAECNLADEIGVAVIADLREVEFSFEAVVRLASRPSIAAVLIDAHQLIPCDLTRLPPQAIIAVAVYPDDAPEFKHLTVPEWCDVVVVELGEKPLLADAVSHLARPVIAIRRGVAYADFHEARAACDRLQADLTPDFNLAGYIVAP